MSETTAHHGGGRWHRRTRLPRHRHRGSARGAATSWRRCSWARRAASSRAFSSARRWRTRCCRATGCAAHRSPASWRPRSSRRRASRARRSCVHAFRPDVVLGTGGFASATVVLASMLARIPRVLQEQNSVPGLVNRRLARYADLVLLGYDESRAWLPAHVTTRVRGQSDPAPAARPARGGGARSSARRRRCPVVLVDRREPRRALAQHGGRGRRGALARVARRAVRDPGRRAPTARKSSSAWQASPRVRVLEYLDEVHFAYSLADVAVARSGASSCVRAGALRRAGDLRAVSVRRGRAPGEQRRAAGAGGRAR